MEVFKAKLGAHCNLYAVGVGVLAVTVTVKILRSMRHRRSTLSDSYPVDTVILHMTPRAPYAPNMSPYPVKLETYLRMAKIPYQNEYSLKMSSKGKIPWITYNGQEIADSAFIIEFLNKEKGVDLNDWLSEEQKAVALAFQRMIEDNFYWVLATQRWVQETDMDFFWKVIPIPFLVRFILRPQVKKMCRAQGMGRHSSEEVRHIARRDLTALTNFIGKKKFLMGDRPCEQDCAVFGQLSQANWQMPGPLEKMFKEEFPVLVQYCERMKDTFWPDWLECTTQGGTVKATK